MSNSDWDDDDGMPDAAFTEDELKAGVQHIMRSGRADACSSQVPQRFQPAPAQVGRDVLRFETYEQAQVWAKANPGRAFTRAADGHGFEAKVRPIASAMPACHPTPEARLRPSSLQQELDRHVRSMRELCVLSPHVHNVLTKSGERSRWLFSQATFIAELESLDRQERARLRMLLHEELQDWKKHLRDVENAIKHDRRMKPGNYGEEGSRWLIKLQERALVILDEHNNKPISGSRS